MSHDPSSPRRRAWRVLLVLLVVVALGACSHARKIPTSYGDTTRDNFIEGCETALTDRDGEGEALSAEDATATCRCSYEAISDEQDGIPFEEFKEEYEKLEDEPGPLPADIRALIDACRPEEGPLS